MKKYCISLVALMAATVSFAQNTLVATLTHGEDISMYYGVDALRNAVNDAISGDVINLSGGGFYSTDITKAITLRGTGIDESIHTIILGDFTINIPTEDTNRLVMEGIRCTGIIGMGGSFENPYFLKCEFYRFSYWENSVIKSTAFVNCKIRNGYDFRGTCSVQFINSYVGGFHNWVGTTSSFFLNCVIVPEWGHRFDHFTRCEIVNCVTCVTSSAYEIPSSSIVLNCVGIGSNNIFKVSQINRDCKYASFEEVFKDFRGEYSDSQTFELTDEAKTTFLGDDGTEVGMYGGMLPYSSTPSYPQITKMNVANRATADGKLSVDIEVSAVEQ